MLAVSDVQQVLVSALDEDKEKALEYIAPSPQTDREILAAALSAGFRDQLRAFTNRTF